MQLEKTYEKAMQVLRENSKPKGFVATNTKKDNYQRVWSRDGIIQGLAAIMSGDNKLIETLKENLFTLKKYQDKTGRIASNIDTKKKKVSYGTLVGKVDATLWYIIGAGQYYKKAGNKQFLKKFESSLDKAVFYLESVELNGKGLLYIPTGGDWADEYITHGYVLFDQLLYLQALKEYNHIKKKLKKNPKEIEPKIKKLQKQIETNFFPSKEKINKKEVYNKGLYEKIFKKYNKKYPLMYFSSDGFADYLDGFANSLVLILNLNGEEYRENIINLLNKQKKKQKIKILPAFWPPIKRMHYHWKVLKMNSLFGFRNKPHHYHNGGLWPLVTGFYIAGLMEQGKKQEARKMLIGFAKEMEKDNFWFHEYFDSKRYKPRGIKKLGFSAAGFAIAYLAVIKNKKVFS